MVPDEIPDKDIKLTKEEINFLLKESGTYFIRWESNFDCGYETEYWHIIKDESSPIESLSRYTRHNIKRGLKRCIIEKTDARIIADEGYESYSKAFERYDTFIRPETEDEFAANILEKENNPEWEFWGVWDHDHRMIAFSINNVVENRCFYRTSKLHPDYLKLYPGDALFYVMNEYYLSERGVKYIDNGPRSLSHKTNIQEYFLTKFNFRKAYSQLHIAYNPKIKILINCTFPFRKILNKSSVPLVEKLSVVLKT